MRVRVLIVALALALSLGGGVASATSIELALVIDASGSITDSNYTLQRGAYANVLGGLVPTDGTVAIGIWQFAATVQQVYSMHVINNAADLTGLVAAFTGMSRGSIDTSATNIAGAITAARGGLLPGLGFARQVIDISTDGAWNIGGDPDPVATAAVTAGIEQINCLGIGAGADCSFVRGTGAFSETVADVADFQTALNRKITRELNVVPEPASLTLLGIGLVALGARFRRRK